MGKPRVSAILDTSALIAPWTPSEDEDYAISVVSLAELHFGVLKATGTPALASRLQRLSEVEHAFDPIPVDERIARAYAECAQAVLQVGRSPRPRVFDLVIAATAKVEGAKLFTFNPGDFRGLGGLVEVVALQT